MVALAWAYTIAGVGMHDMDAASMGMTAEEHEAMMLRVGWTPSYALLMFFMWWIMMIAMMVPSAAPMVLFFAAVNRKQPGAGGIVPTSVFLAGYLLAWAGFSLLATGLQWGLERAGLVSPMMMAAGPLLGGGLLIAAGLYQATPLKQACLRHCRGPLAFLTSRWRPGAAGALRMGVEHGAWCLGCCWFLMALLFVGGVMNVLWIAGLAVYVLIEKVVPFGHWLSYVTGALLVAAGVALIATS